ncbi:transcobalamin-2 [Brienomyrus brachyistius]|uniref:transcobalamin-2 n=1 Tax=Brienomyrus brachyistius TaxID=42636 RepID=UPI0020B3ADD0|nr:transcobalamin-2 [Brienomyrus brachyistius]
MSFLLFFLGAILVLVGGKQCDLSSTDHKELMLSLNKKLLRSLENPSHQSNPSVHLALRLSTHHSQATECKSLSYLKTKLHSDLESSLSDVKPVTGLLALYILALKASCYDLGAVKLNDKNLIHHLKTQLEQEKDHIPTKSRPLTSYYQYSLGILAQCVSGVRLNPHVRNKLIHAIKQGHIGHGENHEGVDTLAMAGMALQCVKEFPGQVEDAELEEALNIIKEKLKGSQRADGHMGNEFSTGLAVQSLLAMGIQVSECSMEALRNSARNGVYHNPMAISQVLPALQQRSYLHVKMQGCTKEDDSLVLESRPPAGDSDDVVLPVEVEVVNSEGHPALHSIDIPKGSTLLKALELLQTKGGFTFETESSLWGPFLSMVNGVQARQIDREYWQLLSDGTALTEGIGDFKIVKPQKISIKKMGF